MMLATHLSRAF